MAQDDPFMDSFDALNHLYAGYNARHVALVIVNQFNRTEGIAEELDRSDRVIAQLKDWAKRIWDGFQLIAPRNISNPTPETLKVLHLLDILVRELESYAANLDGTLKGGAAAMDRPAYITAAAAHARLAYREHYLIQGFLNFARRAGRAELVSKYEAMQPDVGARYQTALATVERLPKLEEWTEQQLARLMVRAMSIPGLLRIQKIDTIQLIRKARDENGFERFRLDPTVSQAFAQNGYDPYDASAWTAAGLEAFDAALWRAEGLNHPGLANEWVSRGFNLDAAVQWMAQGVSAEDAAMRVKFGM